MVVLLKDLKCLLLLWLLDQTVRNLGCLSFSSYTDIVVFD